MLAELTMVDPADEFSVSQYMMSVHQILLSLRSKLSIIINESLAESLDLGISSVVTPLQKIGEIQEARIPLGPFADIADKLTGRVSQISRKIAETISESIRDGVGQIIRAGSLAGDTLSNISTRIRKFIGTATRGIGKRLRRGVINALTLIFNIGTDQAQDEANKIADIWKRWVSMSDGRVRPSHLSIHLQTIENPIPINRPFIVGGEPLRFPRDPRGSPKQISNCRCWSVTSLDTVAPGKYDQEAVDELRRRREQA